MTRNLLTALGCSSLVEFLSVVSTSASLSSENSLDPKTSSGEDSRETLALLSLLLVKRSRVVKTVVNSMFFSGLTNGLILDFLLFGQGIFSNDFFRLLGQGF